LFKPLKALMNKIFLPYNFLLIAAILVLLTSYIIPAERIGFTMSFTTILITKNQYFLRCALFLILLSVGYKFFRHHLRFKILSWVHIIFSISLPLVVYWSIYHFQKHLRLIEVSSDDVLTYSQSNERKIYMLILLFAAIQILPIINLLFTSFYKSKNPQSA